MSSFADTARWLYDIVMGVSALLVLVKWARSRATRQDQLDRLLAFEPKLTLIVQQLLPNGGKSLFDRVSRAESHLEQQDRALEKQDQVLAEHGRLLKQIQQATAIPPEGRVRT